jgi:hypothetical protein
MYTAVCVCVCLSVCARVQRLENKSHKRRVTPTLPTSLLFHEEATVGLPRV